MIRSGFENKTLKDSPSGSPVLNQYEEGRSRNKSQLSPPHQYSINLMFLNSTFDEKQEYILPRVWRRHDNVEGPLSEILEWKKSNPEASVNFWFDSAYVSQKAIKNTQEKLFSMGGNGIVLRDIRDIPIVKNNPDIFSDNVPIYFRVDLMKFIICLHSMENDKNESAIFTDFLVGSLRKEGLKKMTKEELFSPEMLISLQELGLKAGLDRSGKMENQFLQVMPSAKVLNALKFVINICLNLAATTLNLKICDKEGYPLRLESLSDFIYSELFKPIFFKICLKGLGGLGIRMKGALKAELFDPIRHGYDLFGNTVYGSRWCIATLKEENVEYSSVSESTNFFSLFKNDLSYEGPDIQELFSREVYSEKIGMGDSCNFETLKQREPEGGSKWFKCTFIPMTRENIQEAEVRLPEVREERSLTLMISNLPGPVDNSRTRKKTG